MLVPRSFYATDPSASSRNSTACASSLSSAIRIDGRRATRSVAAIAILAMVMMTGCSRSSDLSSNTDPRYRADLEATVAPPAGWIAQPVDRGNNYATQVWVSPTGDTALGVIRFNLPLPVGHEWALWGFMQNMRKSEGRADLVSKEWDDSIKALRFVAEGGRYRVRAILRVDGLRGWSVFAGTLTGQPINDAELKIAETAREDVTVARD